MREPITPLSLMFLNPTGVEVWGGVEGWMYACGLGLRQRGHRVCAAARDGGKFSEAMGDAGIATIAIRGRNDHSPTDLLRLRRAIRDQRVDLVITKLNRGIRLAGVSTRLAGLGTAVLAHMGLMEAKRGFLSWLTYRAFLDGVNVPCRSIRDRLVDERGFEDSRVHVVPYGIDTMRFYPDDAQRAAVRRAFGLRDDLPVAIVVARLDEQKGHGDFLQALARLDRVQGLIVGTGPLEGTLRAQAEALGVAHRAHFVGHRDDVPHVLHGCDVLVLSSYDEGLPFVALEAMAEGLPIVATRVGGLGEIVRDGETGYLVDPGHPDRLADAIDTVLSSPDHGRALGRAGRALILSKYDVGRMLDGVELMLHDVVARRRDGTRRAAENPAPARTRS